MDPYVYSPFGKGLLSRPPGLCNNGNECYINAVLQCLYALEGFKAMLCQGFMDNDNKYQPLTKELESLFLNITLCEGPHLFCTDFLRTLQRLWPDYEPHEQNDAADFMQFILGRLHDETEISISKIPGSQCDLRQMAVEMWESRAQSPIMSLFGILIVTKVHCVDKFCQYERLHCDEPSRYLTLCLIPGGSSLEKCLVAYSSDNLLCDAVCPKCSAKGTIKQSQSLARLPPVFVVHLSRFTHPGHNRMGKKNDSFVAYPHILEMKDNVLGGLQSYTKYKLTAVTNHVGSLATGHYTAYCSRDERWFFFDDSKVSNTTSRRTITDGAYLLWYTLTLDSEDKQLPFDAEIVKHIILDDEPPAPPQKHPQTAAGEDYKPQDIPSPPFTSPTTSPARAVARATQTITSSATNHFNAIPNTADKKTKPSGSTGEHPRIPLDVRDPLIHPQDVPGSHIDLSNPLNAIPNTANKKTKPSGSTCEHPRLPLDVRDPLIHPQDVPGSHIDLGNPLNAIPNTANKKTKPSGSTCEHPRLPLDVRDPLLHPTDVPGSQIDVRKTNVKQLTRQLQSYGLPIKGRKKELIERINHHRAMGKGDKIDPAIDDGDRHWNKKMKLLGERSLGEELPILPGPRSNAWKPFPSIHIPEGFSSERIGEYFSDIPLMKYSYKEGIISATPQEVFEKFHDDTSDDDVSDDDAPPSQQITDLCRRAITKCIDKGRQFLSSGRLLGVVDTSIGDHYVIKGQVQASMEATIYISVLFISMKDGRICGAECSCKAQSLQRCGHIAAVCLMVCEHVLAQGHEATTTTGRECYWRKAAPPKNPGYMTEKNYETRRSKKARIEFDPRPTKYKQDGPASSEDIQRFKEKLLEKTPTCVFLYHFEESEHLACGPSALEPIQESEESLQVQCQRVMQNIVDRCAGHSEPFEVPNTKGQYLNDQWHLERRDLVTANNVKAFLGLTLPRSKILFLRRKIWGLNRFKNDAMDLGIKYEDDARKSYERELKERCPEFHIEETGLWKNPKYPQMACSPDGFIIIEGYCKVLLEIKVLTVLRHDMTEGEQQKVAVNPNHFEEQMTKAQKSNFYLRRNQDGEIELKPTHSYYYQIQMSLDILELKACHLLVWSTSGAMVVLVLYNADFWNEKRCRVLQRHREFLVPEVVLGRTRRWLEPMEMCFEESKDEDPDDPENVDEDLFADINNNSPGKD